jgi:hypothetical protein
MTYGCSMLTILTYLSFVTLISAGNLALGFGLAVHLGHGPARGWQALCFWERANAPIAESRPVEAHHGH